MEKGRAWSKRWMLRKGALKLASAPSALTILVDYFS